MKMRGKKTLAWERTRRKLKVRFERAGIVSCELRVCKDCKGNEWLSFAHSKKRRFITTQEELEEVVICCTPCHDAIEGLAHIPMAAIVRHAIQSRETQP